MIVLGISCFYHDSAASLIKDGVLIAAAEEERFSRKKHDKSFPVNAINFCLSYALIDLKEIDAIVFYDKPILKFDRILESHFFNAPMSLKSFLFSIPLWINDKLFFKKNIKNLLNSSKEHVPPIFFSEHHLSHAASAFYPSPYDEAAILCVDGVGEWVTTSGWYGHKNKITSLFEIDYPHSLGLFYSAFTSYLGFKVNSGEYKLMGLAPFGEPKYRDLILNEVLTILEDGSYQLNLKYFNFNRLDRMYTDDLLSLLNVKPRSSSEPIDQFHMDLAASVQSVLESALLALVAYLKKKTQSNFLVLSGGVALNCVANSKLRSIFTNVWVQPAAGDSGGSLGAALAYYHLKENKPRDYNIDNYMQGSLLGPSYHVDTIQTLLDFYGFNYIKFDEKIKLYKVISKELESGRVIGLFQGRMEFGPRSLGCRSIIADPRITDMQSILNSKIKKRESFRPFAPAILKEHVADYFEWPLNEKSPFMLFTAKSKRAEEVPAVTHVDGTSRLQVVDKSIHEFFHSLISEFYNETGCPLVINTSFNVRGEPIVQSPAEAINGFMSTEIDVLVLEDFVLFKNDQPEKVHNFKWKDSYRND